jgi:putative oxidoreductase
MMIMHGLPKITGGPAFWEGLGKAVSVFGITFAPVFWGFMSAFAEFFGGIFLILGVFFRTFSFLLLINMTVALGTHFSKGDNFGVWSHAAELGILFLSLLFIGAGQFTLAGKNEFLKHL